MSVGMGLREKKKQRTRRHVAHIATTLFIERGFDNVTIADVAAEAEVSKMTVTNYFCRKENLVFDTSGWFVDMLADTVRARAIGASARDALRDRYLGELAGDGLFCGLCTPEFAKLVDSSPRLRACERELLVAQEERLAETLAAQVMAARYTPVQTAVIASALASAYRTLFTRTRELILAGTDPGRVRLAMRRTCQETFAVVDGSIGEAFRRI